MFSKSQLQRYPVYLRYFITLRDEGFVYASSPNIAKAIGFSEEQVRKDLQAISPLGGRPKKGRKVEEIIASLEQFLGYTGVKKAFLIGAGHLGSALLNYTGFASMGIQIVAGFDSDPAKFWQSSGFSVIYPMSELSNKKREFNPEFVFLCVPSSVSQKVADEAIKAGFKAIWNFAPALISVPPDVTLENVNLASSLAVLVHRYEEKLKKNLN